MLLCSPPELRFHQVTGNIFQNRMLLSIEAHCRSIGLEKVHQLSLQMGRDVQGRRSGAELCACERYPCSGCHPRVAKAMQG